MTDTAPCCRTCSFAEAASDTDGYLLCGALVDKHMVLVDDARVMVAEDFRCRLYFPRNKG